MGNIFVVEDDEAIREMLKYALELEGYTVFTAANGLEGIAMLPTIPRPSFIILDLMMPVMDGWGFVSALEQSGPYANIPVVVITAYDPKDKPINASLVINKPIDLKSLYAISERYCRESA